jgi:hypothetical protein
VDEDNIATYFTAIKRHFDDVITLHDPKRLELSVRIASIKIEYDTFLMTEYEEILERYVRPNDFPMSRSRMVLYGWQSMQKLRLGDSDPLICFYLIKNRAECLRDDIYKDTNPNVIRGIVTIRFYLFCLCAVSKISPDAMQEVITSYTQFLQRHHPHAEKDRSEALAELANFGRIVEQIKVERFRSGPDTLGKALRSLAEVSVGYGCAP